MGIKKINRLIERVNNETFILFSYLVLINDIFYEW